MSFVVENKQMGVSWHKSAQSSEILQIQPKNIPGRTDAVFRLFQHQLNHL